MSCGYDSYRTLTRTTNNGDFPTALAAVPTLGRKGRHHHVLGHIRWPHGDIDRATAPFEAARTEAEQHDAPGERAIAQTHIALAMTTHQLAITPDELRGRATSAVSTLTTGALSIGTLAGGALITTLGAKPLVWLCGVWLLILALLTTANRAVRQAPPAAALSQQQASSTAETADTPG